MDGGQAREPARPQGQPDRRFIPLTGTPKSAHRPQFPGVAALPTGSDVMTTSFMAIEQPKTVPPKLPDIFTTCPELRNFKPIISLPDVAAIGERAQEAPGESDAHSSGSKFDPNEPILRPYVFPFKILF